MSQERVFGIDLGTTYSCIAHVDEHGKPVVLPNKEGDLTTPSVVYFESPDSIVVGKAAKEVAAVEPEQVVSTVKRMMGDGTWQFDAFGQTYRPQDVSSFILRKVAEDAEAALGGEKIHKVVITCPAYFGVNEKEATKQAGLIAGLDVLYVIPEPTAAALCYGIDQTEDQTVLVYDLGGGTFDVTVINIAGDAIDVVCTGGDHQLGGKNWDEAIVQFLADSFSRETGIDAEEVLDDLETYQELLNAAEEAKKTLSSRESTSRPVRFGGKRAKVDLTREAFDEITDQYLKRTISLTEQEIEKAKAKGIAKVDKLLLVGGSTYMPQVIQAVEGAFPGLEILQFDPNQAVAKGAAVYGFKCFLEVGVREKVSASTGQAVEQVDLAIGGEVVEKAMEELALQYGLPGSTVDKIVKKKITNVTAKSFGIVVIDPASGQEVVTNLIHVNDKVPVEVSQQFGTYEEKQRSADVRCMENLSTNGQPIPRDQAKELGTGELDFGKGLPAGSPVEITFRLTADGLLNVHGQDLTTGSVFQASFQTDSIMEKEELEEAKSRNLAMLVS
ncbi:MAG: Hsp70 family protein [Thermoanaerobaculia bacterium]|nr:Hsp70 family protein [Thermoanaerobaculia bacterium]